MVSFILSSYWSHWHVVLLACGVRCSLVISIAIISTMQSWQFLCIITDIKCTSTKIIININYNTGLYTLSSFTFEMKFSKYRFLLWFIMKLLPVTLKNYLKTFFIFATVSHFKGGFSGLRVELNIIYPEKCRMKF